MAEMYHRHNQALSDVSNNYPNFENNDESQCIILLFKLLILSIHWYTKYLYLDSKRMVKHVATQNLQDS